MPDAIESLRSSLSGEEAAAAVRNMVEGDILAQEAQWPRIQSVVSALTRRGQINHFSDGIRSSMVFEKK